MAEACVFVMENVDFNDLSLIDQPATNNQQPVTSNQQRETRNTHINIGTGKEISIKQLAELIKIKTGFRGELIFNSSKPDGTLRKLTDPSKIHMLGWQHKIEIDEGIEKLYDWYIKNQ